MILFEKYIYLLKFKIYLFIIYSKILEITYDKELSD